MYTRAVCWRPASAATCSDDTQSQWHRWRLHVIIASGAIIVLLGYDTCQGMRRRTKTFMKSDVENAENRWNIPSICLKARGVPDGPDPVGYICRWNREEDSASNRWLHGVKRDFSAKRNTSDSKRMKVKARVKFSSLFLRDVTDDNDDWIQWEDELLTRVPKRSYKRWKFNFLLSFDLSRISSPQKLTSHIVLLIVSMKIIRARTDNWFMFSSCVGFKHEKLMTIYRSPVAKLISILRGRSADLFSSLLTPPMQYACVCERAW